MSDMRYLGQRSFSSKVIVQTHAHTPDWWRKVVSTTTSVYWPYFQDNMGKPAPEW